MKFTADCLKLKDGISILFKKKLNKKHMPSLKIEATKRNRIIFELANDAFETDAQVEVPGSILMYPKNFHELLMTFKDEPIQFVASKESLALIQGNDKFSISIKKDTK